MTHERPSVETLVAARMAGDRDDPWTLGLAVDGGGMRGVVTGGMLAALHELGVDAVCDRYYGCSSGALNLARAMVGGTWSGLALYWESLADSFVRAVPRGGDRFVRMSVVRDLLRREVLLGRDVFDADGADLSILLTDMDAKAAVIARARDHREDLLDVLIAGAWLPLIAGRPPKVDGKPFCDGYILRPYAFDAAAEDGCTHVIALTSSGDPRVWDRSFVARQALGAALDLWSPGLGRAHLAEFRTVAPAAKALARNGESTWRDSALLWLVPKRGSHEVRPFTTDKVALLDGLSAGYAAVWNGDFFRRT